MTSQRYTVEGCYNLALEIIKQAGRDAINGRVRAEHWLMNTPLIEDAGLNREVILKKFIDKKEEFKAEH
jgi:hypothetical protein